MKLNETANVNMIAAVIMIPVTITVLYALVMVVGPVIGVVLDIGQMDSVQNSQFYSDSVFNNVVFAFDSWHLYVIILAAVAFIYFAINVYKEYRYHQRGGGEFESYYER